MLVVLLSIRTNMKAHQVLQVDGDNVLRYVKVRHAGLRKHVAEVFPPFVGNFIRLPDIQTPNFLFFQQRYQHQQLIIANSMEQVLYVKSLLK